MRIAVFDSDDRMACVAEQLKQYGRIELIDEDDSVLKLRKQADLFDAVVLPLDGIEDNGFVKMRSKHLYAAEFLESLNQKCVLFSGKHCQFFCHLHCKVRCWLSDEELLVQNAALTAEGILCRLIETTERSIFSYCVDIIGSGRCGRALAEILNSLRIPYRFVTTSHLHNDTCEQWISLSQWQKESPFELVVNTAPVCTMTQEVLKNWKRVIQVYDLSTGLCAVDKRCLQHPFLRLYQEGQLPARYAAFSAAGLVVSFILKELS